MRGQVSSGDSANNRPAPHPNPLPASGEREIGASTRKRNALSAGGALARHWQLLGGASPAKRAPIHAIAGPALLAAANP
jgi:hypothetical protein